MWGAQEQAFTSSVTDPYSLNLDPDQAKNLNPNSEDPGIRIQIQAISQHFLK